MGALFPKCNASSLIARFCCVPVTHRENPRLWVTGYLPLTLGLALQGLGDSFYSFIKTEMLKLFLLIPAEMLLLTRAPRELSYSSDEFACNAGDLGSIPGSGRSPEKEMAAHSSIPAWRIPWTE